jgi:hypothetical protein
MKNKKKSNIFLGIVAIICPYLIISILLNIILGLRIVSGEIPSLRIMNEEIPLIFQYLLMSISILFPVTFFLSFWYRKKLYGWLIPFAIWIKQQWKISLLLAVQLLILLISIGSILFVAGDLYSMGKANENLIKFTPVNTNNPYQVANYRYALSQAKRKQKQALILFYFSPLSLLVFGISTWIIIKKKDSNKEDSSNSNFTVAKPE